MANQATHTAMHEQLNDLSDDTVEKLNDLIRINLDSEQGFSTAADRLEDPQIRAFFVECAAERKQQARTLAAEVRADGSEPEDSSSFAGQAHRWWLNLRDKISSTHNYAVLAEAERGEDSIKGLYEDVLKATAGSPVNDVLTHQYAAVKKRHDQVRDLRDRAKAAEDA